MNLAQITHRPDLDRRSLLGVLDDPKQLRLRERYRLRNLLLKTGFNYLGLRGPRVRKLGSRPS